MIFIKQNNKKPSYNLIVVYVSFKSNNIFITINEFIKCFNVFKLHKLIKSYSCGLDNLKNKNKTSLKAYNTLINKLKNFLLINKIKKIYIIFKSTKSIKYIFLRSLLNMFYDTKNIKILNIYINLSTSFNGCRLQKRKFL